MAYPVVFPHFNHFETILTKTLYVLFRCLIQITHMNINILLFPSVLVLKNMLALWNNLIRFKANRATMVIATLEFAHRVGAQWKPSALSDLSFICLGNAH